MDWWTRSCKRLYIPLRWMDNFIPSVNLFSRLGSTVSHNPELGELLSIESHDFIIISSAHAFQMQGPNLTVLNPPLPEPFNFLRIAKFEPFGVPKCKFNGFESSPAWTIEFFKITKFEPFGAPKWLNLTVLNPPLPEPLNFLRIAKFEPFGVPKCAKFNGFESSPAWTLHSSQNRQIWAIWGAKVR